MPITSVLDRIDRALAPRSPAGVQRSTDPEAIGPAMVGLPWGLNKTEMGPGAIRYGYRSLMAFLIDYRAGSFAPALMQASVQRRAGGRAGTGWEDVEEEHPWARLLVQPNDLMPGVLTWHWAFQALDVRGHADFLVQHGRVLGRDVPEQLLPIYPEFGEIDEIYDRRGGVEGYRFTMAGGGWRDLKRSDVLRLRRVHPSAPWLTAGKLEAAAYEIDTMMAQKVYGRDSARDQGKPKVSLKFEKTLTGTQLLDHARKFGRTYRVGSGDDAVPSIDGGGDIKALHISARDQQYIEAAGMNREDLFTIFETPITIFSGEAYATGRDAAMRAWYASAVQPCIDRSSAQLTFEFERLFGAEPGALRIESPNVVPVDQKQQEEIDERRVRRGVPPAQIMRERGEEVPADRPDLEEAFLPATLRPVRELAAGALGG